MIIETDFKKVPKIDTPCRIVKAQDRQGDKKQGFGKPIKNHIKENFGGYF